MNRPLGLGSAGRAAWERALVATGGENQFHDAACRYANAVDLASLARKAWVRQGRPIVETGANGVTGKSPWLRAVEDAEGAAAIAGRALGLDLASAKALRTAGQTGRPAGSGSGADKRVPPPVRLKAVEE